MWRRVGLHLGGLDDSARFVRFHAQGMAAAGHEYNRRTGERSRCRKVSFPPLQLRHDDTHVRRWSARIGGRLAGMKARADLFSSV